MSSSMEFFDVVETAVANAKVLEVMYGKVVPDIGLSPFDEIVKKRFPEERKLLFDLPLRLLISEKLGFYFFKLYLKNYHKSTDICQRSLLSTINFLHSVYVEYLHASSKVERTYLSRRIFKRYLRGVGGVNNGKSGSIRPWLEPRFANGDGVLEEIRIDGDDLREVIDLDADDGVMPIIEVRPASAFIKVEPGGTD
eukprot:329436_1